jgi:predicted ATPase
MGRNLPAQPTRLIGRERDVAAVGAWLGRPDVRLLTLTGPAGVGKTRLAIEAATCRLDAFPEGAYFVDLAPIADPGLVVSTIAKALGVHEGGSQPLAPRLRRYLRDKRLLLLLDNFEHVVPAALEVAELLATHPAIKVLATSRVPLQLRWEHLFAVPPLALPDLARSLEPASLSAAPAVALFLDRVGAVEPGFVLTDRDAPLVGEICVRLDGLPLAIELAAAHADVLGPRQILDGLRRAGLDLLVASAADVPARHRTLRAAIGWSDRLLDSADRALFRRLAVFAGGWTSAAAERVVGFESAGRPIDVPRGIASLVRREGCSDRTAAQRPDRPSRACACSRWCASTPPNSSAPRAEKRRFASGTATGASPRPRRPRRPYVGPPSVTGSIGSRPTTRTSARR